MTITENSSTLLDPKNDYVFKRLFAEAPRLLIALINAVRADEPAIIELEVLNPKIDPEELAGKYIILDVQAMDETGKRYNVEMQVRRYNAWSARSAFYLARMLSQQLEQGEDYSELKPAIGIHLLDFDLFQTPDQQNQAVWCFEMRDRHRPAVRLGKELQLNLIELRKADKLGLVSEELNAWITFFEHWQEELTMANIAYEPVKEALARVKELSADEEARRLAFVRERAVRDEISLLNDAKSEGRKEGLQEGRQEGLLEGEARLLTKQIKFRFGELPDWVIDKLAEADTNQLEQWGEQLLQVETLEQVFEAK